MVDEKKEQAHSVSVDKLKSAFKEGATPNEKDYGALIDLAAVGSQALGAEDATPTTPAPGDGLKMDKGKLTVSAGNGVIVDVNGVAVKGDEKSVTVTDKGVGIQVKADGGLTTDEGKGLHVKLGAGLKTGGSGLEIMLAEKSGLKADTVGLAVNVAAGLEVDKNGVLKAKVKAGEGNYITSGTDGLAITKEGVTAIEQALKSVSLQALQKADEATNKGFKVDATAAVPTDSVQKKIEEKLNTAFTEGWHLTQPREALFTALRAFRSANKAKIFENGLIAPSAVTGHPGLYNQGGVEYTTGTVIAYKVRPSGDAEIVNGGAYTEDGIYALVGKLDTAGKPKQGDSPDKVTQQALMVLVVQGVVTVVGHWDFKPDANWTGPTSAGGWSTAPAIDGVVKQRGDAKKAEDTKAIEQLQQTVKDKDAYIDAAARKRYQAGLEAAASVPTLVSEGSDVDLSMSREGKKLKLRGSLPTSKGKKRWDGFDHRNEKNQVVSKLRVRLAVVVYGQFLHTGRLVYPDGSPWQGPRPLYAGDFTYKGRSDDYVAISAEMVYADEHLEVTLTWPYTGAVYTDESIEYNISVQFGIELYGCSGGIQTILTVD